MTVSGVRLLLLQKAAFMLAVVTMYMLEFCNMLRVFVEILESKVARYILLHWMRCASSITSCQRSRKVVFAEINAVFVG